MQCWTLRPKRKTPDATQEDSRTREGLVPEKNNVGSIKDMREKKARLDNPERGAGCVPAAKETRKQ